MAKRISSTHRQNGISLIEMLVGLVIALVVMSGAFAAYLAIANSSRDNIRTDRINIDTQTILQIMSNDIRRAGYCNSEAASSTCSTSNPFSNMHIENGCILYSYDSNADGAIDGGERYGFKMTAGVIRIRTEGTSDSDCSNGSWESLSDSTLMNVQNLSISTTIQCVNGSKATTPIATYNDTASDCITELADLGSVVESGDILTERRHVSIQIVATATHDETIQKAANTIVEIRNDRRIIAP